MIHRSWMNHQFNPKHFPPKKNLENPTGFPPEKIPNKTACSNGIIRLLRICPPEAGWLHLYQKVAIFKAGVTFSKTIIFGYPAVSLLGVCLFANLDDKAGTTISMARKANDESHNAHIMNFLSLPSPTTHSPSSSFIIFYCPIVLRQDTATGARS